jgi:phosphate transport system permease protein
MTAPEINLKELPDMPHSDAIAPLAPAPNAIAESLRHKTSRIIKERLIELLLLCCGLVAVFTTVAITVILVYESLGFFEFVNRSGTSSPARSGRRCSPTPVRHPAADLGHADDHRHRAARGVPMGTIIAIYLSEFASHPCARRSSRRWN